MTSIDAFAYSPPESFIVLETSARNSKCQCCRAPLCFRHVKTDSEDARWLRLTDRNVRDGNSWLGAMPELWFGGVAVIWTVVSSLLTLFR